MRGKKWGKLSIQLIKGRLLLGRSYDQPRQHIKKQRHYFANKGLSSQIFGFSSGHVWMWELGVWRKLTAEEVMFLNCGVGEDSRVPWTARRSNQLILKEISPEYSLEGLMLKLKLQYFGHLMQRTDSLERPWCWERLKAGREGDNRGWDGWMAHHQIDGHEFQQASGVGDGQEAWHAAVHEITKSWTWLSNWTEYNYKWHTQSWWNVFEVTNSVRVK